MNQRIALWVAVMALLATTALAAPYPAFYVNSFENPGDVSPPAPPSDDVMFSVTRVGSGTNGIASATGGWHAEAAAGSFCSPGGCQFTRYGGYGSVFPNGGYVTSLDIYLDTAVSPLGADIRLDWSSAISDTAGSHRRDFIFSVGTDGSGGYVMSASNNAPGWPANPARDPLTLTATGWYTFTHAFYDDGTGVLAVDMSVLDAAGNVLKTWTLSDPTDVLGVTVGGNRYGWLVTNGFSSLPIDNLIRTGAVATTKAQCKQGGWKNVSRADGSAFKNQGDCIQYVNTGK